MARTKTRFINPSKSQFPFSSARYFASLPCVLGLGERDVRVREQGAVAMRPDDVSVLIPRGSVFLSAALHVPSPEVAKRDFQVATDDYEKVLRLQTPVFSKLSVHSRGELLGGLAEARNGLGDTKKSRGYLQRMTEELADTSYSRRAKDVLSTAPKPGAVGTTCLGCHGGAHLIVEKNNPLEITSSVRIGTEWSLTTLACKELRAYPRSAPRLPCCRPRALGHAPAV